MLFWIGVILLSVYGAPFATIELMEFIRARRWKKRMKR